MSNTYNSEFKDYQHYSAGQPIYIPAPVNEKIYAPVPGSSVFLPIDNSDQYRQPCNCCVLL